MKKIGQWAKKQIGMYKSPSLEEKIRDLGIGMISKKSDFRVPYKMRIIGHRFGGAFVNKLIQDLCKNTKIDKFMFEFGIIDCATFGSTSLVQNIMFSKKTIPPSDFSKFFKMRHGHYDIKESKHVEVTDDGVYEKQFVPFIQIMDLDDEVTILRRLIVPDVTKYDDILNIQWSEHTSNMN
jgi:hypothetical protein